MRPFEKWLLLLAALGTALTGGVYAWMRYLLEPVDPWAVIHHPLEPWVLKAHILVSPVLVFAVGMVATGHVWKHLRGRVRPRRRTGILTTAVFAPMVVSGYLLQAVTSAGWLKALVVLHLVTGTLFAVGLAVHFGAFLRRRDPAGGRAAPERAPAPRPRVVRRAGLPAGERAP